MFFKAIPGQEALKEQLINSVKKKKVSHAWLFTGNEGFGGLPLALAFAQYLNCENKEVSDSCGKCHSCLKILKLIHPDLYLTFPVFTGNNISHPTSEDYLPQFKELVFGNPFCSLEEWHSYLDTENKQSFFSVDESQRLIKKINLTNLESPYQVIIMWRADKLRVDAANKLLKNLEEPTGNTIFILLCPDAEMLLSTIRSRVQQVRLKPFTENEIEQVLYQKGITDKEKALQIAFLSEGNLNKALQYSTSSEIEASANNFLDWMRICFKKDAISLEKWINETASSGRENQKLFIDNALSYIRASYFLGRNTETLVKMPDSAKSSLKKFSPYINNANLPLLLTELNSVYYQVERNINSRILFMDLCLKVNELLALKE